MSDYNQEIKKLKSGDPERLYLIYGDEDYLVSIYLDELRKKILPDGDDGFCYKYISASDPDITEIRSSVDAVPFLSDRTLVELRDPDLNKYKDSEKLCDILSDIPEYCTVIISLSAGYSPDKRLKIFKKLNDIAEVIVFDYQSGSPLVSWIKKRFRADRKIISSELCERLIFISGSSMSGLIPEISKISSYSKNTEISLSDIETVAHHIPEADIYKMTDCLADGNVSQAVDILSDLLILKENDPIAINALIASSFKRIYAAKMAEKYNQGWGFLRKNGIVKLDFIAEKTFSMARKIKTSTVKKIISICVETDYALKGVSVNEGEELLKETFAKIAAEVTGKC